MKHGFKHINNFCDNQRDNDSDNITGDSLYLKSLPENVEANDECDKKGGQQNYIHIHSESLAWLKKAAD